MDIRDIKKGQRRGNLSTLVSIRITPEMRRWAKQKNYSPTLIFREAMKELGFKENQGRR